MTIRHSRVPIHLTPLTPKYAAAETRVDMSVLLKPHANVAAERSTARFYLADCLEVFRQLPAGSVDVIVTSPPYNLGIRYNRYQDTLSASEYLEWTSSWIAAAARVLRPEGSLFLNVGAQAERSVDGARRRAGGAIRTCGCRTSSTGSSRSRSIADAAGAAAGLTRDLAVGHYKPINSDRFLNDCHEFIFHFTPHGATRARSARARRALSGSVQHRAAGSAGADGVRCRGNTWFIPYETIQRRDRDRPHPATFPSRLPEQCLRLHGLSRDRDWRWIRSPGLGARRSRARGWA